MVGVSQFHSSMHTGGVGGLLSKALSACPLAVHTVLLRAAGLIPNREEDRTEGALETVHLCQPSLTGALQSKGFYFCDAWCKQMETFLLPCHKGVADSNSAPHYEAIHKKNE